MRETRSFRSCRLLSFVIQEKVKNVIDAHHEFALHRFWCFWFAR
ncbi:hypothetical protein ECDEC14C_3050 [Escherichia coli DEC14C]|nr:hypothetical protein ECDEC14C_3050 [Escherichia coli DEC14C]